MARALFCVCAPGATQDTTRFFRAILKGCIPVTFFRCPDLCSDSCPDLCPDLCPTLMVNPCIFALSLLPARPFCLHNTLCPLCIQREPKI